MNINPSEFTCLGTMKAYTSTKNEFGGAVPVLAESKSVWCKVRDLSGSTNPTQGQIKSNAQYEIMLRYDPAFTENWIFNFGGMDMAIKSISLDNPAYKRFMILNCTTDIQQTNWS